MQVLTTLDAKLVKIRRWLSGPDPSINFQKARKLREANTGLWLLKSNLYKKWKAEASTVWLHGIPGCGKTVLSSTLLENILEHTTDDPGKAVAYFYFDFNDRQKQNPEMMIRSLISQLSQQFIDISPGLDALFSACESGQRQRQLSLDELLGVLQQLIEEFPCTYVIVDALDECDNRKELMSVVKNMSAWQGLHLLFTSRREGDIESTLGRILHKNNVLCIQNEAVDHDIRLYVRQRLSNEDSLQKWQVDDAIRQRIESSLIEGAHGM
jgi:Cdc6-like AAA superfamily ATPase